MCWREDGRPPQTGSNRMSSPTNIIHNVSHWAGCWAWVGVWAGGWVCGREDGWLPQTGSIRMLSPTERINRRLWEMIILGFCVEITSYILRH